MENKGESDYFLEILENLEILEILEILPVKRPPFVMTPFSRSRCLHAQKFHRKIRYKLHSPKSALAMPLHQ